MTDAIHANRLNQPTYNTDAEEYEMSTEFTQGLTAYQRQNEINELINDITHEIKELIMESDMDVEDVHMMYSMFRDHIYEHILFDY